MRRFSSPERCPYLSLCFRIIRAALGLLPSQRDWEQYPELFQRLGTRQNSFLKASGILDAELVPYSEEKEAIDGTCHSEILLRGFNIYGTCRILEDSKSR